MIQGWFGHVLTHAPCVHVSRGWRGLKACVVTHGARGLLTAMPSHSSQHEQTPTGGEGAAAHPARDGVGDRALSPACAGDGGCVRVMNDGWMDGLMCLACVCVLCACCVCGVYASLSHSVPLLCDGGGAL